MSLRDYAPPAPLLVGYDPFYYLPSDHLSRLVEGVVEETVSVTTYDGRAGQPGFDLRLLVKVLVYAYATGIRSSRQMERLCEESLPYLFLTRGDTPSYRTLCKARKESADVLEDVWTGLFVVAKQHGLKRCGKLIIDSSKFLADASPEAVVRADEYTALAEEFKRILAEAEVVDRKEEEDGGIAGTRLGKTVERDQMRDILRRVRAERRAQARQKSAGSTTKAAEEPEAATTKAAEEPEAATTKPTAGTEATTTETEAAATEMAMEPDAAKVEASTQPVTTAPPAKPVQISRQMSGRIVAALGAIKAAEKAGLKHLCLTDPDARMMGEGRLKRIKECHAFEVAVDQGLLVAAETTTQSDNQRLIPLVEAAGLCEPDGVNAVDADSGYWRGDDVVSLETKGIDTCIPDSHTACDLHRSQPIGTTKDKMFSKVPMTYDPQTDTYHCPKDNVLVLIRTSTPHGQEIKEYHAKNSCVDCPLAALCLTQKKAKRRTLMVAVRRDDIQAILARFKDPDHQQRYHRRGDAVETVFGFIRSVLGINRWQLRGAQNVAAEAKLIACAYQVRKIQSRILSTA